MPVYEYYCPLCHDSFEAIVPIAERDMPVGTDCKKCDGKLRRNVGNKGGFRLKEGSVGWAKEGYATHYGDAENFKAGRKVYE